MAANRPGGLYERLGSRRSPQSDMIVENGPALRSHVFDLERP
jgi:hypothetical protein